MLILNTDINVKTAGRSFQKIYTATAKVIKKDENVSEFQLFLTSYF